MKTKLNAFVSPYSDIGPAALISGDPEKLSGLTYYHGEKLGEGYTLVGTAEVEVTLFAYADLIESKRKALEAQLQKEIADSYVRQQKLQDQIQNLLALPSEVTA